MTEKLLLERLARPDVYPLDVVLDTDAYNEIDDQYALAYLIGNKDKLDIKAICAAPFSNFKAGDPGLGMELSYDEILNVLDLLGENGYGDRVFHGSRSYLPSEKKPVRSAAAERIVELALKRSVTDPPLYVVAIGAATDVASAILMEPSIIDRIVVVWLGGHAHHWPVNDEFNMKQDVAAARILFDSCVPVVQLPCMGVVSAFTTTGPELRYWLKGKNRFCDYMVDFTEAEAGRYAQGRYWSRAIWDVTAVGWLVSDEFQKDCLVHSPVCQYDNRYSFDQTRHFIRYVYWINRDALIKDLFEKISC